MVTPGVRQDGSAAQPTMLAGGPSCLPAHSAEQERAERCLQLGVQHARAPEGFHRVELDLGAVLSADDAHAPECSISDFLSKVKCKSGKIIGA